MFNLWSILILAAVGVLIYRYNRQVLAALRRFDQRNVDRIRQEMNDRNDMLAHFRHTANVAEEQVEDVGEIDATDERLGTPVKRYVFEGELFATRDGAEAARQRAIIAKARDYYKELPAALAARGKDRLH
ncbi:MAG TPA: hypothetical protein VGG10_14265 [Rhizomicrobium sp.]